MEYENKEWKVKKGEIWSSNRKLRRFQKIGMALVFVSVVGVFTGTIDGIMWFLQEVVSWVLAVVILFYFLRWLFT